MLPAKKWSLVSGVSAIVFVASALFFVNSFSSYQTNKEIWNANMANYEEAVAAGDMERIETEMSYADEAFIRVTQRKTEFEIAAVFAVLSAVSGVVAFKKRKMASA